MSEHVLVRLIEHNNWANLQIVEACWALSDEQLDAEPEAAVKGSIRNTLWHLVAAQDNYVCRTPLRLAGNAVFRRVRGGGDRQWRRVARPRPRCVGQTDANHVRTGWVCD